MPWLCWLLGHRWEWLGSIDGGTNPDLTRRFSHLYGCRRCDRTKVHFLSPRPEPSP